MLWRAKYVLRLLFLLLCHKLLEVYTDATSAGNEDIYQSCCKRIDFALLNRQSLQLLLQCINIQKSYDDNLIQQIINNESRFFINFEDVKSFNVSTLDSWRILRCLRLKNFREELDHRLLSVESYEAGTNTSTESVEEPENPSWTRPNITLIYPFENEVVSHTIFREIVLVLLSQPHDEDYSITLSFKQLDVHENGRGLWRENFNWTWNRTEPTFIQEPSWRMLSLCILESCETPVLNILRKPHLRLKLTVHLWSAASNWHSSASRTFSVRKYEPLMVNHEECLENESDGCADLPGGVSSDSTAAAASSRPQMRRWSHYDVAREGQRFDSERWFISTDWRGWAAAGMAAASLYLFTAAVTAAATTITPGAGPGILPWPSGCSPAGGGSDIAAEREEVFDFPMAVMNLRHRRDKRAHMRTLLPLLGFTNITFPPTTYARDLDLPALLRAGAIAPSALEDLAGGGPTAGSVRPYLAIALDYVAAVRRAAAAGHRLFAVAEDDLAPGACPAETRRRIAAALEQLPPTADMLYLEACFEDCDAAARSAHRPALARAARPACSGAIVFTAKGAAKISKLCWPVYSGTDSMFPGLIAGGHVEAYVAVPGLLFQDGYWGSDNIRPQHLEFQAQKGSTRRHAVIAPLCIGCPIYRVSTRARLLAPSAVPSDLVLPLHAPAPRGQPQPREAGLSQHSPVAAANAAAAAAAEQATGVSAVGKECCDVASRGGGRGGTAEVGAAGYEERDECEECVYMLLEDPAALCDGCEPPHGGRAGLLTRATAAGAAAAGPRGLEVHAWALAADMAAAPAAVRLDRRSACWAGGRECHVTLVVYGSDGAEISVHPSVVLLSEG